MERWLFIDTDILIDFSKDKPEAVQSLVELERDKIFCVSVIVAMELYAGCRSKKELKNVESFLIHFKIILITKNISELAFFWMKEFRSSHGVEINDMLIAATASSLNSELISKNKKHYQFLPNLKLLEYPWNGV